jgi:general secretion pathway protein J
MRRAAAGFTLVEVLVAIAIFVIIGAMAMGGYNNLTRQSEQAQITAERSRSIQATFLRLTQDFEELDSRPVREPLGTNYENALEVLSQSSNEIRLTRAGWSNPAGVQRPTLQRVRYRLDGAKLIREYWVVLDPTPEAKPVSTELLTRVKSLHLRYLDANNNWHDDQWPPPGYGPPAQALCVRPSAVEIALELEDWGKITRLIETPGS